MINPLRLILRPRAQTPTPRPALETLEARNLLSASGLVAQPFVDATPLAGGGAAPYTPAQIRHAYGFDQITFTSAGKQTAGDGTGQTIAIVDAYDDPNIASNLHTFDRAFGLADPKLVVATPQGKPVADSGWAFETSLDVEWAHAIAPKATILLVEARSSSLGDLLGAVSYASNVKGVSVVSMSWGAGEFSSETNYDGYFTHPNVSYVASSGDNGAGASWPSISTKVLSVGGTSLHLSGVSYGSESAWGGSGGGYSSYVSEPAYQYNAQTSGRRSNPDVAYNADPNTGFYVYDTTGASGWYAVGGTSAGAPQWAALVAIANQGRALAGKSALSNVAAGVYAISRSDFRDVTTGSNGYSAHAGYDLTTGLGTPIANKVVADLVGSTTTSSTIVTKTTTPTTGNGSRHAELGDGIAAGQGNPGTSPAAAEGVARTDFTLGTLLASPRPSANGTVTGTTLFAFDDGALPGAQQGAWGYRLVGPAGGMVGRVPHLDLAEEEGADDELLLEGSADQRAEEDR